MYDEYKRVKACKCYLPIELHTEFMKKISIEGWTVQEALLLMIRKYVEEETEDEN